MDPVERTWPPTPQRWQDAGWRHVALGWADDRLAGAGVRPSGWTLPHARPWSAAFRADTDTGPWWLKANGDGTRHEAGLTALLAALHVPFTPRPLAVDTDLGLSLLPDGGPTVRDAHDGPTPLHVVEGLLADYAAVQRSAEPHTHALIAAGVDDLRPERLPDLLSTQIERMSSLEPPVGLPESDVTRLRHLLPAFGAACTELAESGIAPTLQHDDLHDANVFARGPVFFDWGDAAVGHPFGTLLVSLRSVASRHGLPADDPALLRLADAYTESWTDVADRATLRRQARLAVRVGPLTRTLAWLRALDGVDEPSRAECADYPSGWLMELEADDLPLLPARL